MNRTAVVVLLSACAGFGALFSACGGDDDPVTGGNGDSGTGNEVSSSSSSGSSGSTGDGGATGCTAFAEAVCNRQQRCAPLGMSLVFGNIEACKEGYKIICDRMTTAPGAQPINVACIDAYGAGVCGDDAPLAACATGSKGTLTDGTPCEFDGQCASGRCGSAGGTPGCGLCKAASDASSSGTPATTSSTRRWSRPSSIGKASSTRARSHRPARSD